MQLLLHELLLQGWRAHTGGEDFPDIQLKLLQPAESKYFKSYNSNYELILFCFSLIDGTFWSSLHIL